MRARKYLMVSGTVFALIGLGHLARVLLDWHFQIGTWVVPYWISWGAVLATGFLSGWGFRQAAR